MNSLLTQLVKMIVAQLNFKFQEMQISFHGVIVAILPIRLLCSNSRIIMENTSFTSL